MVPVRQSLCYLVRGVVVWNRYGREALLCRLWAALKRRSDV